MEYKINKDSVEIITGRVELTNADELSLGKSLTEYIFEARQAALKEDIKANTVMISKRLAKVNRFVQSFVPSSYAEFPPLICGLEAYVTDEMPKEFAFGLVEAPMTQREAVFEDGRKTGYRQGYKECAREIFEVLDKYAENTNFFTGKFEVYIKTYLELKKKYVEEDNND